MHNMVAANGDSHFDDMDKPVMFSHILHRRLLLGSDLFWSWLGLYAYYMDCVYNGLYVECSHRNVYFGDVTLYTYQQMIHRRTLGHYSQSRTLAMDPGKHADNIGDFQRYYKCFADSDSKLFSVLT